MYLHLDSSAVPPVALKSLRGYLSKVQEDKSPGKRKEGRNVSSHKETKHTCSLQKVGAFERRGWGRGLRILTIGYYIHTYEAFTLLAIAIDAPPYPLIQPKIHNARRKMIGRRKHDKNIEIPRKVTRYTGKYIIEELDLGRNHRQSVQPGPYIL